MSHGPLLTLSQAARLYNIPHSTLRDACAACRLRATRLSRAGRWRTSRAWVDEWILSGMPAGAARTRISFTEDDALAERHILPRR